MAHPVAGAAGAPALSSDPACAAPAPAAAAPTVLPPPEPGPDLPPVAAAVGPEDRSVVVRHGSEVLVAAMCNQENV
jgi:hypothetical protein